MRYLGGGIGHLQQFPPAHNDDEGIAACDKTNVEVETANFLVDDDAMGCDSGGDSEENSGSEDYESEEEDDEAARVGRDEDTADDDLDEEAVDVY